jgi:3-hydroxyacyl-CoA dehydrogenase
LSSRTIARAVVIGAGTMGGGIAAHFANAGIPVYLLDVVTDGVLDRLRKHKPPMFFTPETADLVTVGQVEQDEAWIAEGDWIVEAIYEEMDAKRDLVARIDRLRKPDSIVSSNTSGLPISRIAVNASEGFRRHFIGTHFFNPPRYMKLLEVIPTADTDRQVVHFVRDFAEERLGKGVVFCKDTPNFIANRLMSVGGASLTDFALEHGYTVEEVDAIAGPLIGRPKTAAFRLQDLVGLDVASAVGSNLYGLIEGDESREVLRSPRVEGLRKSQMDKGRLGDKSKQGFYKKDGTTILSLDLNTGEYREREEPRIPSLSEAAKMRNLPERLRFVLQQEDKAGALARHAVYNSLGYASRRIPEISDDLVSVDRATRWGFSHDLGPFELWDALGVRETAAEMEKHGVAIAPWVREMLDAGNESFYRDGAVYSPVWKSYVQLERDPRELSLKDCRVVKENKGASLRDLGDRILCLEFHTKMNALDEDISAMLAESVEELERGDWAGLVIGNQGDDFCAGADVAGGGEPAVVVKGFRDALVRVRLATKPVVAAPFGRTLGGGVEVALAASRIVAAGETYMGLAEAGAGAAKVSSSAEEARSFGFLREADRVVMNRDRLLHEAKQEALALAGQAGLPLLHHRTRRTGPR